MVFIICKERNEEKKFEFLFDLFSLHSETMKRKQMRDFAEIFGLQNNFFGPRGASISKQDFIEDIKTLVTDFEQYERCKYIMIAMLGLMPEDDQEEKESILAVLDNNHNVETYIHENLEFEEVFYAVDKNFFDSWAMNVNFLDSKSFIIKKDKQKIMDNLSLVEGMHDLRMKEVSLNEEFLMVPKFVF